MQIKVLRALDDNYMYLIIDEHSRVAAAVDPVEPDKVLREVEVAGVKLKSVLTTHHHWDHAGGNNELMQKVREPVTFYGGDDRIPGVKSSVKPGEIIKIGTINVECLFTPCHTSGHVCYYVRDTTNDEAPPAVFTGDTLFLSGCGKFFEGSPQQMYTALIDILGNLPHNTQVYCGHEYAINNLKYALHVQPNNRAVAEKLTWVQKKRDKDETTVPSTIGEEKTYNPFMRVHETEVQHHARSTNPIEVMGYLRNEKDRFGR